MSLLSNFDRILDTIYNAGMPKRTYSRIFAAVLPQRIQTRFTRPQFMQSLGIFITVFMVSFTATLGMLFYETFKDYRANMQVQQEYQESLSYWESVIAKYPQFPAAYYEAAVYAARLSENNKAREFIDKALFIDPNFFEAEVLAKELE